MKDLAIKDTITSLELVEQINIFRGEEGKKKDLRHDTLLNIIRDEFEEEINAQKILEVESKKHLQKILEMSYKDKYGREQPMYTLTLSQAKQILMRESKFVRRAMIHYIEELEKQLENTNKDLLTELTKYTTSLEKRIIALENGENKKPLNEPLTVSGYARLKGMYISPIVASNMGKMATHICQIERREITRLYDCRFGFINAYPIEVLERVFEKYQSSKY